MGEPKGSCDEAASSKADELALDSVLARRAADTKVSWGCLLQADDA